MAEAIVFTLPESPDGYAREAHWWRVADGRVVESGAGTEWIALAAAEERQRIALAPAAQVRIEFHDRPAGASERQAASVARVAAVETSLGEAEALHSVSALAGDKVITAVVDNGVMLAWLDWSREAGADPHHVVPVGSVIPLGDEWVVGTFGSDQVIGREGLVLPFEAALLNHLAEGAEPRQLSGAEIEEAIASAAVQPTLDLRVGKMARRRRIVIDRGRIRELVVITMFIPALALVWSIVSILKLESSTDQLNDRTLVLAERALGRPVTLETAESELSQRVGGAAYGGVTAPLTGLYSALQAEQGVSSTQVAYSADGTLSATLAAPTVDPINRLLVAVQRDGYRVTAVPRQAPDGRSMVDVTVRSRP